VGKLFLSLDAAEAAASRLKRSLPPVANSFIVLFRVEVG
jgi:hypothetical protein